MLSLDIDTGERQWLELQSREPDPDRAFLRSWAASLIDQARSRLEKDYEARNRLPLLQALLPRLTHSLAAQDYARLGEQIALSSSAVKVAMHRLRQRFGSVLREVVAETVEDPNDVDAELNELLGLLSNSDF